MYSVYFLNSQKNNDLYIGSTEDIENRLKLHNSGRVRSTKSQRPWKLLGYELYNSRGEAVRRERFLKSHQQREILKKKYGLVAKW
ncbi:MAG: GIY-YIG nuclease family protein [Patescibacteria group bacterium]